jgi:hypothetical protein
VAIKLEHESIDPSLLREEVEVYKSLAGGAGIPTIYWFGREGEYRAMVFELLGPSLEDLFNYCGLLYFLRGSLPWQKLKAETKAQKYKPMMEMKSTIGVDELCDQVPREFTVYMDHVRALEFEDKPDYTFLRRVFRELFIRRRLTSRLDGLILRIFRQHQSCFYTWVKLHDVDSPWGTDMNFSLDSSDIASPIYYASLLGLDGVLHALIDTCQDNRERKDLVNAQGGHYGNALQAASVEGHEKVVQMLLNAGADINAQGGHYGNTLQAASYEDHDKVVQMLLNAGADVNAQGGYFKNALYAASTWGHDKVVQMLLDAGAEVNVQGGRYDNALQAASDRGHEKVVQMLIDAGAVGREHRIEDIESDSSA